MCEREEVSRHLQVQPAFTPAGSSLKHSIAGGANVAAILHVHGASSKTSAMKDLA